MRVQEKIKIIQKNKLKQDYLIFTFVSMAFVVSIGTAFPPGLPSPMPSVFSPLAISTEELRVRRKAVKNSRDLIRFLLLCTIVVDVFYFFVAVY